MNYRRFLFHAALTACAAAVTVVIPVVTHLPLYGMGGTDAVSGASVQLPDQVSGEFLIFMNRSLHPDTIDAWSSFFRDEDDLPVIFEDIDCLTARGDLPARQMAERCMLQLPENQMSLGSEDGTLLASKAEAGRIDVAVFSKEMADALGLAAGSAGSSLAVMEVTGEDK